MRTGLRVALWLASIPALFQGGCAGASPVPPAPPAPAPAAEEPSTGVFYGPEPEVRPSPLEEELLSAARARLRLKLTRSPVLSLAARELAARRAAGDRAALSRAALRLALARAGAFDEGPSTFAVCTDAPDQAVAALAATLPPGDQTHAGAGVAGSAGTTCAVLLASHRRARLERFPRDVAAGARAVLRGRLLGLSEPRVFVTDPAGRARPIAVRGTAPFSAPIAFDAPGRWRVELIGTGPTGPQVAALLLVSAGGVPLAEPERRPAEPDGDDAGAEARVLGAVNGLRARNGLPALAPDDALRDAARRQSSAMLAAGILAHVLPGSEDAGARLRRAGIPYRRVLENLARSATAIEAQESLEESPAHLGNLLDPQVTRIGVGVARGRLPSGDAVLYLTQLLVQPVDDASDTRLRPEERVREALWKERERLGRPPLLADPALDAIASRAARAMLRAGSPDAERAADEALALGRKAAAADAFVAASPADATRSTNLSNGKLRRVGVGVAVGDHPRYGAGLLWIAVIYTD